MNGSAPFLALGAGIYLVSGAALPARAGGRVLAPFDTVSIRILDQPDLSESTRVEADGTVNVPYVGRIRAVGLTEDGLAEAIERRLVERKILARP
jgi:polysaccharide biosynthesis/export protein